jgi:hypothetical protein
VAGERPDPNPPLNRGVSAAWLTVHQDNRNKIVKATSSPPRSDALTLPIFAGVWERGYGGVVHTLLTHCAPPIPKQSAHDEHGPVGKLTHVVSEPPQALPPQPKGGQQFGWFTSHG